MVNWWHNSAVESSLAILYVRMMYLLLGVYGWEYFHTFTIEYAIIYGRLPFRWSLIPYLIGRISLLTCLFSLVIGMSPSPFACEPGTLLTVISGAISIGCSSMNLMIRTWVIWKDSRLVHILVSLATLGHWAILILNMPNIRSYKSGGPCVIHLVNPTVSAAVFVYTMCYDFFVLVLSFVKLSKQPSKSPLKERLRTQGILYFAIAAMSYVPPTVFCFLGGTPLVGITGTSAMTASTIGSSRAVNSLLIRCAPHSSDPLYEGAERDVVLTTQVVDHAPNIPTDVF